MNTEDTATPIYPLTLGYAENFTDFTPHIIPADAPDEEVVEEQEDPKGDSAQEPASSPESSQTDGPTDEDKNVQTPAAKVSTLPKVPVPGS